MKLCDLIRNDIENESIVSNGKLPTLRQLADRYKCGVTSVKRAFDRLEQDGVIRVVRGQGNFVIGHKDFLQQKKAKIIGAIMLQGIFMSELSAVRDKYLDDGWLFSIYDSLSENQSPEKERLFLRNAEQHNFSACVIAASPKEPLNSELFMSMRAKGIKIIHITPYKEDMSDECYFMTDYRQNAELAVWKIAIAGYKKVIYIGREHTAPHVARIEAGLNNALHDAGLTLVNSFTVHHKETDEIIKAVRMADADTAILAFDTEIGEIVRWCSERLDLSIPADFGLLSVLNVFGVNAAHSHIITSCSEMVRDVMEYATNAKRSPFEKVQKLYRGEYYDMGSLK